MAAPFPPQGNQSPHTERPLKIYGEQYVAGQALPIGAVVNPDPALFTDGLPRVFLPATGWRVIVFSEWVLSSRYSGAAIEVISNDEFAERFGPGGAPLTPESA